MKFPLACLLLCLVSILPARADKRVDLIVAANQAPPYRVFSGGKWGGFYFEVFDQLARQLGFSYVVVEAPVARSLRMMQDGDADVMLGPVRTAERETFMVFTSAVFPAEPKVFFRKPGSPDLKSWSDLPGKTISILKGGSYSERFDQDTTLLKDEISDYLSAIRKVDAGRSDAVLMPELQGDVLLRDTGIRLDKCGLIIPGTPSHIAFSRKSSKIGIITALEKAMARLYEDGSLARIRDRYR